MCVFFLRICMISTLNLDAQKDQKMVLNPLELELQTVVRAIRNQNEQIIKCHMYDTDKTYS